MVILWAVIIALLVLRSRYKQKQQGFSLLFLTENLQVQNIGRELVFSADLCYNGANEKPPSKREGDRVSGGRSLRDFRVVVSSLLRTLPQSASLTAPSRREPQDARNLRGMGFALCLCNTKAKLAIK